MKKALKIIDQADVARREEMELLISHRPAQKSAAGSSVGARAKFYCIVFFLGFLGSSLCLWAMLDTDDSKEKFQEIGLHKVANSLENILSVLAYPVLMFTVILCIYALQQLYKIYREVNDPSNFGRNRRRVK